MSEQRFCGQCARSLVPLVDRMHVERKCTDCGKSVFLAESGEGGGLKIQKGDNVTIPRGWLKMSFDPAKSTGRLYRPGVTFLATHFLAGGLPTSNGTEVEEYLERLKKSADDVLEGSDRLAHLDLEDESDAEKAIDLLRKERSTVEWWAFLVGVLASSLLDRVRSGEPVEPLVQAFRMQAAHSMLVFKQSLEEHVWTGYKHTSLIYDIASVGARTPQEAEKIEALRPLFERLDEDVLHAWVESGVDIGPRIDVTAIDEELLKGLAKYHLSLFERRRQEDQLEREHSSRVWANRISGAVAGAAILGAVITALRFLF